MEIELKSVSDVRFNEPGTKLIFGQFNGNVWEVDFSWNYHAKYILKYLNKRQFEFEVRMKKVLTNDTVSLCKQYH